MDALHPRGKPHGFFVPIKKTCYFPVKQGNPGDSKKACREKWRFGGKKQNSPRLPENLDTPNPAICGLCSGKFSECLELKGVSLIF
tara:strand:- start:572 stop:829 length:258 start_codon:yes stop_codon:yes gene_type:complete